MRNDAASLEKGRTPDELLELVKNGTDKSILLQAASSIDMTDALFSGSGRNKRQRLHRPNDSIFRSKFAGVLVQEIYMLRPHTLTLTKQRRRSTK
jgi:hypothetical protein